MITREEIGNDKVYDLILEAVKRKTKGLGKLFKKGFTEEEAALVESLKFVDMEIQNLEFFRYLPNLSEADFCKVTGLVDIMGVTYAKKLDYLYFEDTDVPDLNPVGFCTNLTSFYYEFNEEYEHLGKSDFSFIRNLYNLNETGVMGNPLTDLSIFTELPNLEHLILRKCPVVSFAPLQTMDKLWELTVEYCGLKDLEEIVKIPNLKFLSLEDTEISPEQVEQYQQEYPKIKIYYEEIEE